MSVPEDSLLLLILEQASFRWRIETLERKGCLRNLDWGALCLMVVAKSGLSNDFHWPMPELQRGLKENLQSQHFKDHSEYNINSGKCRYPLLLRSSSYCCWAGSWDNLKQNNFRSPGYLKNWRSSVPQKLADSILSQQSNPEACLYCTWWRLKKYHTEEHHKKLGTVRIGIHRLLSKVLKENRRNKGNIRQLYPSCFVGQSTHM